MVQEPQQPQPPQPQAPGGVPGPPANLPSGGQPQADHCMHQQQEPNGRRCCWCGFSQTLATHIAGNANHGPNYGTPEYEHVWQPTLEEAGACQRPAVAPV